MHLQDSRDRHRCRLQNWQTIQKSMPLDWHFEETKEGELPDDQGWTVKAGRSALCRCPASAEFGFARQAVTGTSSGN